MKKQIRAVVCLLLFLVIGGVGFLGKSQVTTYAQNTTELQTEGAEAADAEEVVYEGLAEMPGIIKYMIFSLIGVVVLSIIAGIYCAVTPPGRRK